MKIYLFFILFFILFNIGCNNIQWDIEPLPEPNNYTIVDNPNYNKKSLVQLSIECGEYCKGHSFKVEYEINTKSIMCYCWNNNPQS